MQANSASRPAYGCSALITSSLCVPAGSRAACAAARPANRAGTAVQRGCSGAAPLPCSQWDARIAIRSAQTCCQHRSRGRLARVVGWQSSLAVGGSARGSTTCLDGQRHAATAARCTDDRAAMTGRCRSGLGGVGELDAQGHIAGNRVRAGRGDANADRNRGNVKTQNKQAVDSSDLYHAATQTARRAQRSAASARELCAAPSLNLMVPSIVCCGHVYLLLKGAGCKCADGWGTPDACRLHHTCGRLGDGWMPPQAQCQRS